MPSARLHRALEPRQFPEIAPRLEVVDGDERERRCFVRRHVAGIRPPDRWGRGCRRGERHSPASHAIKDLISPPVLLMCPRYCVAVCHCKARSSRNFCAARRRCAGSPEWRTVSTSQGSIFSTDPAALGRGRAPWPWRGPLGRARVARAPGSRRDSATSRPRSRCAAVSANPHAASASRSSAASARSSHAYARSACRGRRGARARRAPLRAQCAHRRSGARRAARWPGLRRARAARDAARARRRRVSRGRSPRPRRSRARVLRIETGVEHDAREWRPRLESLSPRPLRRMGAGAGSTDRDPAKGSVREIAPISCRARRGSSGNCPPRRPRWAGTIRRLQERHRRAEGGIVDQTAMHDPPGFQMHLR